MAKPGPRRQPLEIAKKKRGDVRMADGSRVPATSLEPIGGGALRQAPTMPVGHTKRWQNLWKSIVPLLRDSGVLDRVDAMSLEMLVDCLDEYYDAGDRIRKAKLANTLYLSMGTNGAIAPHPALKIHTDRRLEFMKWSDRFGLDPSARAGLLGLGHKNATVDPEDAPAKPTKLSEAKKSA